MMTRSELPPLHPQLFNRIENERCPKCGIPGQRLRRIGRKLEEWGCPACDGPRFEVTE